MEAFIQIALFIVFVVAMVKPSRFIRFDVPIPKRIIIVIVWLILVECLNRLELGKEPLTPEQEKYRMELAEQRAREDSIANAERNVGNKCQVAVILYLKSSLNDPDSYEEVSWSKVDESDAGYSITHKFRAKNGFGGKILTQKTFYMTKDFIITNVK